MSDNNDQTKQVHLQKHEDDLLTDDEAFIQSVYDEIELEAFSTADNENPSKANDDKILAAAHKAVNSVPTVVSKKRSWYVPVASAASLMLVFSLFVNQLDDVNFQSKMTPSEISLTKDENTELLKRSRTPIAASSSVQYMENEQAADYLIADTISTKESTDAELQNRRSVKQTEKMQSKQLLEKSKVAQRANSISSNMASIALTTQDEQNLADHVKVDNDNEVTVTSAFLSEEGLVPEHEKESGQKISILTAEQIASFINEHYSWSYDSEGEAFYLVKIFSVKGDYTLYKVDKKAYYINEPMKKEAIKRSFRELKRLTIIEG